MRTREGPETSVDTLLHSTPYRSSSNQQNEYIRRGRDCCDSDVRSSFWGEKGPRVNPFGIANKDWDSNVKGVRVQVEKQFKKSFWFFFNFCSSMRHVISITDENNYKN